MYDNDCMHVTVEMQIESVKKGIAKYSRDLTAMEEHIRAVSK